MEKERKGSDNDIEILLKVTNNKQIIIRQTWYEELSLLR